MPKLTWDAVGARLYETGVKKAVLFVRAANGTYPLGVPWNGLISISESPSGAEPSPLYADDIKYLTLMSLEEFAATIEAYTYPEEFEACDGSKEIAPGAIIGQQTRSIFGLAYESIIGNDVAGNDYGRKLHLIYGLQASPAEKPYASVNDSPEAMTFSWEATSTPVPVTDSKPTSILTIDTVRADPTKLAALEKILFGGSAEGEVSHLPLPDEIKTLLAAG